jgi:hypothetical protein
MDTPGAVKEVTAGVGKAISLQNVIFVAVVFVIVIMLVKYFTKQEIVTVQEDGQTKSYIKSTLGLPKKAAA